MYSKSLPTRVYTKASRSRPKRAYANAYATYAVCMGAYMSCGIPPLFFCIQEKEKLAIAGSNAKHHGSITHHIRQFPNKINGAMRPSTESPHLFATKHMCYAATPWI